MVRGYAADLALDRAADLKIGEFEFEIKINLSTSKQSSVFHLITEQTVSLGNSALEGVTRFVAVSASNLAALRFHWSFRRLALTLTLFASFGKFAIQACLVPSNYFELICRERGYHFCRLT